MPKNKLEIINWGDWRIAWLSPSNCQLVRDHIVNHMIDGVGLSPHHGFNGDFTLLDQIPEVNGIVAVYFDSYDCEPLLKFSNLRFLDLHSQVRHAIDFRAFQKLTELSIT